jgi:hypothetical protein
VSSWIQDTNAAGGCSSRSGPRSSSRRRRGAPTAAAGIQLKRHCADDWQRKPGRRVPDRGGASRWLSFEGRYRTGAAQIRLGGEFGAAITARSETMHAGLIPTAALLARSVSQTSCMTEPREAERIVDSTTSSDSWSSQRSPVVRVISLVSKRSNPYS